MTTETGIRPVPDLLTTVYWDAAAEHRLVLQRCGACGRVNQPPQPTCGHCGSHDLAFAETSGTGTVYSWTSTLRRPGAYKNAAPADIPAPDTVLVVAVGDDPDALLIGRVSGRPDWIRFGAPVSVTFRDLTYTGDDGVEHAITIPDFVHAEAAGEASRPDPARQEA